MYRILVLNEHSTCTGTKRGTLGSGGWKMKIPGVGRGTFWYILRLLSGHVCCVIEIWV